MKIHLIQSHDLFGPPERQDELRECWRRNEGLFDHYTHPEGRLTFTELFALCNPGMVNVLCNSDIYFEDVSRFNEAECWALSRWENGTLYDRRDSQDVWVFKGRPDITADFTLGLAGCDNRLARILKDAGMNPINPSRTIKAHHLHNVPFRSYLADPSGKPRGGDKIYRVPGPYAFIEPAYL